MPRNSSSSVVTWNNSDSNNINLHDNAEMGKFTRLVATVKCVLGMRPIWQHDIGHNR